MATKSDSDRPSRSRCHTVKVSPARSARRQFRPGNGRLARCVLFIYLTAPGFRQRIILHVKIVIAGTDTGISDLGNVYYSNFLWFLFT